jgi:hypothetical protein
MKNIFLSSLLTIMFSMTAFAGDIDNTDPAKPVVKRSACIKNGGSVTDDDKRYFICDGGKYDGMITAGPAANCAQKVDATQELYKAAQEKSPELDEELLESATAALDACRTKAVDGQWASLQSTLKNAKKACDEGANQGMSQFYRGSCYLKAAELGRLILNL